MKNLKGYAVLSITAAENCTFNFVGQQEKEDTAQMALDMIHELPDQEMDTLKKFEIEFNSLLDELKINIHDHWGTNKKDAVHQEFLYYGILKGKNRVLKDGYIFGAVRTHTALTF